VQLAAMHGDAPGAPHGHPAPGGLARDHRRGRAALASLLARLHREDSVAQLRFPHPELSLSHSGDWAIAAASAHARGVGVDLEFARPMHPRAARFFLVDGERNYLDTLPGDRQADEALRLWTVKEAVFKARADNAGGLLTDIALDDPAACEGTARAADGAAYTARWCSIDLGTGWLALALATPGAPR